MAYNVDVYKNGIKLGSGSATNGSATIATYTAIVAGNTPAGRNVQIAATGGNNIGAKVDTRILVDGTTTLTLQDKSTFT